jgi:hypothetical protein
MRLDVRPELEGPERIALEQALGTIGARLRATPDPSRSAWIRAARLEAVDRAPSAPRYTPSPRSTRGATRA